MFEHLVESSPERNRSAAQAALSIVVHTVIIAISIQLTRAVAESARTVVSETPMILARAPLPVARSVATPAPGAIAAPPALVPIAPPIAIPGAIPPVSIDSRFDPTGLKPQGRPGGIPGPVQDTNLNAPGLVVAMQDADEQSRYLDGPVPKYPPALRRVGVEGFVQLRFIVGVDGRAEPASIAVQQSSNGLFEAPAAEAILASRFVSARIRGRKVRQIVEQVVRFTLH